MVSHSIIKEALLNNPEVSTKMGQVLEIIKRYYPNNSPEWGLMMESDCTFDVYIGTIESGLEAGLNLELYQDCNDENFPKNFYRLLKIEFHTSWTEEHPLDIMYVCMGAEDNSWFTDDTPPKPDKIEKMCDEIFVILRNLAISSEVFR